MLPVSLNKLQDKDRDELEFIKSRVGDIMGEKGMDPQL